MSERQPSYPTGFYRAAGYGAESARCNAASALTIPPVEMRPANSGRVVTDERITDLTCVADRSGRWAIINAATPLTIGAANEVPLETLKRGVDGSRRLTLVI